MKRGLISFVTELSFVTALLEPPHGGPMKRLAISFPEEKKQPTTDYSEPQPGTQRITSQCDQGSVRSQGHPLEN